MRKEILLRKTNNKKRSGPFARGPFLRVVEPDGTALTSMLLDWIWVAGIPRLVET